MRPTSPPSATADPTSTRSKPAKPPIATSVRTHRAPTMIRSQFKDMSGTSVGRSIGERGRAVNAAVVAQREGRPAACPAGRSAPVGFGGLGHEEQFTVGGSQECGDLGEGLAAVGDAILLRVVDRSEGGSERRIEEDPVVAEAS